MRRSPLLAPVTGLLACLAVMTAWADDPPKPDRDKEKKLVVWFTNDPRGPHQ